MKNWANEVKEGPQGNAFETAGVPLMETKPADTSGETYEPGEAFIVSRTILSKPAGM